MIYQILCLVLQKAIKEITYEIEYMSRNIFKILRSLKIHLTMYERSKDTDLREIAIFD